MVESLFYNTPARLKYIKSLYTELGKITDIVNRMAMSHPDIRISLVSDGKTILKQMDQVEQMKSWQKFMV